jgi:hypothetical protein
MSLRGDMIRRARRRVDARRDARNRANIRDQARANYGRNLGKRRFAPTEPKVGGAGDAVLNTIRGAGGDFKKLGTNVKDAIFPVFQKAMKGIEALGANWERSKKNKEILGDVYTDDLRKSMMTDDDLEFYNKYMKLGDMRSGQEAQYYYDQAQTALQNSQITNRINYALGQPEFGFETTAPAGVANIDYSTLVDRMVGGTDASTGLEGTAAGKAFLADAYKAQADETGDTLISQYMKNYPTTFVGGNEMLENYAIEDDGIVRGLQKSDVAEFDPYLSPSFPFYDDNRQKYMNYLFQSGAYDQ